MTNDSQSFLSTTATLTGVMQQFQSLCIYLTVFVQHLKNNTTGSKVNNDKFTTFEVSYE
jgi:hypothetical protein